MNSLNITIGYNCNYTCAHCGNSSSPGKRNFDLTKNDMLVLESCIRDKKPKKLVFAGGEPTLYLDQILKIIDFHPDHNNLEIEIVTNGWFAESIENTEKILKKIKLLTKVNLSFDFFHKSSTTKLHVSNVYNYCNLNKLKFKLITSISNPLHLLKLEKISEEFNMPIEYQTVINVGRARKNKLAFPYYKFQESTLEKKCPSKGNLVYLPNKGFSVCCSILAFEEKSKYEPAYDTSLKKYMESEFYDEITNMSLGDIAKKYNIDTNDLDPMMSEVCSLCEYIYVKVRDKHVQAF